VTQVAAIALKNVSKTFVSRKRGSGQSDLPVLRNVDLNVADGEFLCILGTSGSGKSTILNLVAGLEGDYDGTILINDIDRAGGNLAVRVAYVFQDGRLLPWATVRENVLFALKGARINPRIHEERAREWIAKVGLSDFSESYPHELSGGMQQRVAIARAFAVDPDVLLMDEPFSGLDEFTGRQMREQVLTLWRDTHKTIVFVTHHCFEACFLADRIAILGTRPGRIVEEIHVPLERPRDYEDTALFELSVALARKVNEVALRQVPTGVI
jgi:NitT/TauT family transport system ATP-binding protein